MSFVDELVDYYDSHRKEFSSRVDEKTGFRVFKYSRHTQYDCLWNRFTRECRGLIIDSEGQIVSYPFSKFFNYGIENEADKFDLDEKVYAIRKINGFLAIVSVHKGQLVVSTAGSLDSEYVDQIREFIDEKLWLDVLDEHYTYMFECVPEVSNHVIIEEVGLTLLGYREKVIDSPIHYHREELSVIAEQLGCHISPIFKETVLRDLLEEVKEVNFEGFVVYSMDGSRCVKMKGKKFLFERFLVGITEQQLEKMIARGKVEETVEEEFIPLVRYIIEHKDEWLMMSHLERVIFVKKFLYGE